MYSIWNLSLGVHLPMYERQWVFFWVSEFVINLMAAFYDSPQHAATCSATGLAQPRDSAARNGRSGLIQNGYLSQASACKEPG